VLYSERYLGDEMKRPFSCHRCKAERHGWGPYATYLCFDSAAFGW